MNQLKTVLLLGILSAILVGVGGALGPSALGVSIVLAILNFFSTHPLDARAHPAPACNAAGDRRVARGSP